MSNSLDGYHGSANPLEDDAWYEAIAEKYPMLADALLGNGKLGKNTGPVRPPLSLIFSCKEGKLRFSLSSPDASRTYFGSLDDPREPLEAAERCLAGGRGEWVTKQPSRR